MKLSQDVTYYVGVATLPRGVLHWTVTAGIEAGECISGCSIANIPSSSKCQSFFPGSSKIAGVGSNRQRITQK